MKYMITTQKLIIILLEIVKDLGSTMFIAMIMVLALTLSIYGIELFLNAQINWDEVNILSEISNKN